MKYAWVGLLVCMVWWQGCESDEVPVEQVGEFRLSLEHRVDALPLLNDTLLYFNDAGNHYSVYRMEYFLSQVSLIRSDSQSVQIRDYQYVNASDAATHQFTCTGLQSGHYIGLRFNIGIDAAHNIPGGLPNNTSNNNMEWPVPMGGGYHFMKFEGSFIHNDTLFGFAMHLGMNANLVEVEIFTPITIGTDPKTVSLAMNLNEWFRNPYLFDLNTDGNYTMGDSTAMHKLTMNGSDVFTLN